MSDYKPKSLETEGLQAWLKGKGINPDEFILYVDRGATPSKLLKIYSNKIKNWRTIIKYLDQLAHERGLEDRHQLYV